MFKFTSFTLLALSSSIFIWMEGTFCKTPVAVPVFNRAMLLTSSFCLAVFPFETLEGVKVSRESFLLKEVARKLSSTELRSPISFNFSNRFFTVELDSSVFPFAFPLFSPFPLPPPYNEAIRSLGSTSPVSFGPEESEESPRSSSSDRSSLFFLLSLLLSSSISPSVSLVTLSYLISLSSSFIATRLFFFAASSARTCLIFW